MNNVKEILCIHHSHLDVGYTHPQPMALELQCSYIDQVIDLCLKTADWPEEAQYRWTIEATLPLEQWLASASSGRLAAFRQLVSEGRLSIAALPAHTTPGCNTMQLSRMLRDVGVLRERTGSEIKTAISFDVNGQPWPLSQLLLDSGIDFYMTGINIHFGGIPYPRPLNFNWEAPDGRLLPVFLGEHYSLFSQFFFTRESDTKKMHQGVQEYVNRVTAGGWDQDYIVLTATNPPLYDNNSPDAGLADLIRRYNEEGHEQVVRFATPDMLRERVLAQAGKLPVHRGDWSDYWNFGCGSTARETAVNRQGKTILMKAEYLAALQGPASDRAPQLTDACYTQAMLYDEHTWGAHNSVSQPYMTSVRAQQHHKLSFAYTAAELAATLLAGQMEQAADNQPQADGVTGAVVINPTGVPLQHQLQIPESWFQRGRTLAGLRCKEYLPYEPEERLIECDIVPLPPFSRIYFALETLKEQADELTKRPTPFTWSEGVLKTPYYLVEYESESGQIKQIRWLKDDRELLDPQAVYPFFACVREQIDMTRAPAHRNTIFPQDSEKGNRSISQWNPDWPAAYQIAELENCRIEASALAIRLIREAQLPGMKQLKQQLTFWADRPEISLEVEFDKEAVETPEGIYLTFPLQLSAGWESVYDTADCFVRLEADQLGDSSKGWVTLDKCVGMADQAGGVLLASPDAPMVQMGNFHFGRDRNAIPRQENPLLLSWPLNNYWTTNFAASQEGRMTYHYEFLPVKQLDEREMYEFGTAARKPAAVGAVTGSGLIPRQTDMVWNSERVLPLFLRPPRLKNGLLLALRNYSDQKEVVRFTLPGKLVKQAMRCTVQEEPVQEAAEQQLYIEGREVYCELKPKELIHIRLDLLDPGMQEAKRNELNPAGR